MNKEFGASGFSLTKLHQLSINSSDTTAQRFFRRQMREYYFEHFKHAEEHFLIPFEETSQESRRETIALSWEELESYCSLPFMDKQGNKYALQSSRSTSQNGILTIDFQSTHLVTDERGETGTISGVLSYDKNGRLTHGHQNRFAPNDPIYSFRIDYETSDAPVAIGASHTVSGTAVDIPIEDMPFFNGQFLMVDVAEVMRQSL